ncbi:hypothetical protein [Rhizobium sp. BR 314]|uniref:hypothetical protein n=1 Tax=Rhizobium sp. BR 314 TaxID=3040013 RepID=UPI0039BFD96F
MKTVLITGARAPVALHWARLLHMAGNRVILADSHRFAMARATRFKAAYVRLPEPRNALQTYAKAVERVVKDYDCDLVLPTCEEIFFLAAARDEIGAVIPLVAPPLQLLARVHDKYSFAMIAAGFGADPPKTTLLRNSSDLDACRSASKDLVFKPVWSRFAERVLIRPRSAELDRILPSRTDPWVAQTFLPGEELCCWALARDGEIQALQAYRPLYRAGKGASLAFEPVSNPHIRRFVAGFVGANGWTGQISFDFRHDAQGRLSVIECNPRATSGLHYFGAADGLAEALVAGHSANASLTGAMTLPLAMLCYGLPAAIRDRALRRWFGDFRSMGDIAAWPGDRSMLRAQLQALAEIVCVAALRRTGLKAAATADIEWNGEPLGR